MHHFLTAAGLIALVGFAFGANAARALAALMLVAMAFAVAAFGIWVAAEVFEPSAHVLMRTGAIGLIAFTATVAMETCADYFD